MSFHGLKPIQVSADDCPVPLTDEVREHLERAIAAQAQMSGPLRQLTHWTQHDDLIVIVAREVHWLVTNVPVDFDTVKAERGQGARDYLVCQLGGEQDRIWASAIGLMVQRHIDAIFDRLQPPSAVFDLMYEPLSDNDYGIHCTDFDFGVWVQIVLTQEWLDTFTHPVMRSHTECWQIDNAQLFVEGALRKLAKDFPLLGTSDMDCPLPHSRSRALDLWRTNLKVACAALEASRRVIN